VVKVIDLIETTGMARSTIDARIKKLNIKKKKIIQGRGGSLAYITEEDAILVKDYIKPKKWIYYIKSIEIAKELHITANNAVIMAKEKGISGVRIRRDGSGDTVCRCYSPEQYNIIVGNKKQTVSHDDHMSFSTGVKPTGNRQQGLYNRISPYWALNCQQRIVT